MEHARLVESLPQSRDRERLRLQRRRDTKPEILLRRGLHALGYRFRVDYRPSPQLRVRGDLVFTKLRVVVFVDGCFWHSCPMHSTLPKNNRDWWRVKLAANVARDRRVEAKLTELGWRVIRVWEHEEAGQAMERVDKILKHQALR